MVCGGTVCGSVALFAELLGAEKNYYRHTYTHTHIHINLPRSAPLTQYSAASRSSKFRFLFELTSAQQPPNFSNFSLFFTQALHTVRAMLVNQAAQNPLALQYSCMHLTALCKI